MVKQLIEKKLEKELSKLYTAIIGLNPSKGARSPKLWNRAFSMLNQTTQMICIDIENEKDVSKVITNLQNDEFFIGGCIAYPYKETIFKILGIDMIDQTSKPIGAINCLYKDDNNFLRGTNTDGYAALFSFLNLIKEKNDIPKAILIAGLGGAGKAVASFFASHFIPLGTKLVCSSRTENKNFCKSINSEWIPWDELNNQLDRFDTFINCTSLGTGELINNSPIQIPIDTKLRFVYDIIYDPLQTQIILQAQKNNILNANGLEMNLLQAAKAFKLVSKSNLSESKIIDIMSNKEKLK